MKKNNVLILLILVLLTAGIHAQSMTNSQFPPSINWKKIETDYCIIIFPESLEPLASEFAAMMDSFYPGDQYSLGTDAAKWPIVINNSLVETNGYVAGAPRHSQLYTTPDQTGFSGTADWMPFLWSHELRHIIQNEKMMRGFTLFAHWIAGEYGSSGMSHFALPNWVWEGDAVLTETLLSTGGRGRLPGFEREMRTNLLNGNRWNYYKSGLGYYGSYKSRVPSWYVMGYHLCTHIRRVYGIDAFNRILEISADYSFTPLILNIAVKKVTGKSITDIYENCMDELTQLWSAQLVNRKITDTKTIIPAESSSLSDYYPLGEFRNGDIAALKTSASAIYSLIRIDQNGNEQLLRKINPIDKNISFNGSTFCWSERKKDVRWGNRSWAVIRLYSPEKRTYSLLTENSRYLSPSISPDGSRVAAVEISEDLKTFIVVIDAVTGKLISKTSEPTGATASQTCWSDDGSGIIYIRQQDWMKSIRILKPELEINQQLTEASTFNIGSPYASDGRVYYISDKSGIEDVYAVGTSGTGTFRAAASTYGAASPAVSGGRLLFADYTIDGFSIVYTDLSGVTQDKSESESEKHVDYFSSIENEEEYSGTAGPGHTPESDSRNTDYRIENYHPVSGIFNFHSRTIGTSLSGTGAYLALEADGILNYSTGQIYAGWDPEQRELLLGLNGTWAGFFPVLIYGAEIQNPVSEFASEFDSIIYGGVWLPFDFSEGIYSNILSVRSIFLLENNFSSYQSNFSAVQSSISWSMLQYMAKRDIVPPLGLKLSGEWYYNLNTAYYNFLSGGITVYLPGIIQNHGITLKAQANYNFDSAPAQKPAATVPRGLSTSDYTPPLLLNTSIDYSLPAAYPDLNLGGFIYIPRIYFNCFLDTAFIVDQKEILQTTGLEFFADFHLFNNTVPLSAGIRFIYNTINGDIRFEDTDFLIGIDLL